MGEKTREGMEMVLGPEELSTLYKGPGQLEPWSTEREGGRSRNSHL